MNTLSNTRPGLPGLGPTSNVPAWRAVINRLVAAWVARRQARDDTGIDQYFRRERSEHERFLSKASDRYELERLERDWARRSVDLWRVY